MLFVDFTQDVFAFLIATFGNLITQILAIFTGILDNISMSV